MSPRKVGRCCQLWFVAAPSTDALDYLEHTPRRSALPVSKVIESAKANADHNHGYKPATLQITEITVTHGPRLKRYRPPPMAVHYHSSVVPATSASSSTAKCVKLRNLQLLSQL